MAYRTMDRPTFGGSLRLGASFPNHVSSLPAPSLSKRKLFAIFSPYGPIYFVARAPNLLNVLASGRKETHASPIYFWWRRFGEPFAQQLPRRYASGLLTSQVRRRRWKRGLLVSEPI